MQFLKKNQVIIFVIALMFIAAGYLSFTSNNNAIPTAKLANAEEMAEIGDATLVNANAVIEDENTAETIIENENSVIGTSVQITQDEYFSQSRLDRDTMYSQMIESYQKILENDNIPDRIFEIAFAAQIPHLPFHFSSTCINPFKPFAKQNNLVFEG